MSRHYFANQYDRPYGPTVLRNWEVPKSYKGGYLVDKVNPKRHPTKIISNDRGHLVPGVPRPKERPWIRFPTTWHLPNKIDRKTANEISGLSKINKFICSNENENEKKVVSTHLVLKENEELSQPCEKDISKTEERVVEEKHHCPIHDCL
ncbi:hypothetical protein WA026_007281 [Henosepilachna vigintioctopunctata]|uniref:Cilia- and flagella-associated protein 126 n=1 Tax=Henosepilachna vigintioctopunctata TaxID=420089 RepID=A0AAW1UMY0_9CUCU